MCSLQALLLPFLRLPTVLVFLTTKPMGETQRRYTYHLSQKPIDHSDKRSVNSVRPYSTFVLKSRLFHDLGAMGNVFFPSRIYASHTRIIGHAIDGKHIRGGPGID